MEWLKKFCLVAVCSFFVIPSYAVNFEKRRIQVGKKIINVEVAESNSQLEYGLMNRTKLEKDEGMLFIFPTQRPLSFWMKNTKIDLSIAFIDQDRKIINILEMKSPKTDVPDHLLETYPSAGPAKFALEMNKGWFRTNGIKVGEKVELIVKDQ